MSEYDDQLTIRQQRSALANMEQTINDLRRELAAATERERELRDVLRSLEWIEGEYGAKSCYNCCRQEWQGHTEPCLVAAALAAAQPAIPGEDEAYALDDLKAEYRSLTR